MNRRRFLSLLGLAPAAALVAREVAAEPSWNPGPSDPPGLPPPPDPDAKVVPYQAKRFGLKVASVKPLGWERNAAGTGYTAIGSDGVRRMIFDEQMEDMGVASPAFAWELSQLQQLAGGAQRGVFVVDDEHGELS